MKEVWKPTSLNKSIKISNLGNVTGAELLLCKEKHVYIMVRDAFFKEHRYVYTLVWELFGPDNKRVSRFRLEHIDGNHYNNSIENLKFKE